MSKRKDKNELFHCKRPLRIKKKLCKKEWIELKDKVKLQKWQLVKTKIKMKYSSELASKCINFGMVSLRKRWIMKCEDSVIMKKLSKR
jgi:hypothetical protein